MAGPKLPAIPGGDVAGVVAEADADSAFKPGGAPFPSPPTYCPSTQLSSVQLPSCIVCRQPFPARLHTFFHMLAGDRVMGLMPWNVGSYASAVVLPEASLARIPDSLTFEQAATLPLAGLTAHQVSHCAPAASMARKCCCSGSVTNHWAA